MKDTVGYSVKIYKTASGRLPFKKWQHDLTDMQARVAIEVRIDRLEIGNLGQSKSLKRISRRL